jgi:hypothetical protein
MNFDLSGSNGSALLAHLPMHGLTLLLFPLLSLVAIKLWLAMRTGSGKKTPTQWVLTGDHDDNGLPQLARATSVSPEARLRAEIAAYKSRNTR